MNAEVREADKLLILCSPGYRSSVHAAENNGKQSGAGWEALLVGSEMFYASGRDKVVLALTMGEWISSAPDFLRTFPFVDLANRAGFEDAYRDLLRRLFDLLESAPMVGPVPHDLAPSPPLPARGPFTSQGGPTRAQDQTLTLVGELRRAEQRRALLVNAGAPTTQVDEEILELKRKLRMGGRLPAGDCLGNRYLLSKKLGEGGYATVWLARDQVTSTDVAVKVLHPNLAGHASFLDRFRRGARVMADLNHQNIVRVLQCVSEDSGWHYFVMEYVTGGPLSAHENAATLDRNRSLALIESVAYALMYTHARGHVHRDIKPANILITREGLPKLGDFDLVLAHDTTGGTRSGALGTLLYAAPESLSKPQDVDARADVYGLAMTLLFCLYQKDLPISVVRSHTELATEIGLEEGLQRVLDGALTWNTQDRFATVASFLQALRKHRDESTRHSKSATTASLAPVTLGTPGAGGKALQQPELTPRPLRRSSSARATAITTLRAVGKKPSTLWLLALPAIFFGWKLRAELPPRLDSTVLGMSASEASTTKPAQPISRRQNALYPYALVASAFSTDGAQASTRHFIMRPSAGSAALCALTGLDLRCQQLSDEMADHGALRIPGTCAPNAPPVLVTGNQGSEGVYRSDTGERIWTGRIDSTYSGVDGYVALLERGFTNEKQRFINRIIYQERPRADVEVIDIGPSFFKSRLSEPSYWDISSGSLVVHATSPFSEPPIDQCVFIADLPRHGKAIRMRQLGIVNYINSNFSLCSSSGTTMLRYGTERGYMIQDSGHGWNPPYQMPAGSDWPFAVFGCTQSTATFARLGSEALLWARCTGGQCTSHSTPLHRDAQDAVTFAGESIVHARINNDSVVARVGPIERVAELPDVVLFSEPGTSEINILTALNTDKHAYFVLSTPSGTYAVAVDAAGSAKVLEPQF
jgi:serine/threonine-protein kinase